jgi:hypothetical protein
MKSRNTFAADVLLLFFFSCLGFVVLGYHPGAEDDGVYLAAIKHNVDPTLFPRDADFFQLQLQATVFDESVGTAVRWSHLPIPVVALLWQFGAILLALYSCWRIARLLFKERHVQWAGVALAATMLSMPVAGTALYLFDQHLHPRNIATALILLSASYILERRWMLAVPLLTLAFVMHPIMASVGISFCIFLTLAMSDGVHLWLKRWQGASLAAFMPLGWIFEPPNPVWKKALDTRTYYYLYKWHWYEWLGALAPLCIFFALWKWAKKQGDQKLTRFTLGVLAYGIFQQLCSMIMLGIPSLVRLTPLQPMRYLQLVYFFMMLLLGCLLGKYLLKTHPARWVLFLVATSAAMYCTQWAEFPSFPHVELPGRPSANPWLQSFAWVRQNTPRNAYFALDPHYMEEPGNDYHSFRALAERSQLADAVKDTAVVTQVPRLGYSWNTQVMAQQGWQNFKLADFERLHRRFGVNWVLVADPPPVGLLCSYHNGTLAVCQIP